MNDDLEPWIDRVYRFALSLSRDPHVADDLTQECLLRAVGKRESLRNPNKIKSWLFQITANLWRDRLRVQSRRPHEPLDHQLTAPSPSIDSRLIRDETAALLIERMQQLPDRQRNVLFLIAVEQLSHQEVAELLEIEMGAVKANLSLARKRLRNQLTPDTVNHRE